MRTLGLLTLAFASAQEGDETAYLLQTRTLQQKSGEVEDCFVSGGCVTSAPTEAPTTTEVPTTTTTEAPTTTTARPTRPATTTPLPTRPATTTPRPTRPTRPATTTTEATTTTTTEPAEPPPVGRVVQFPPDQDPPSHNKFCGEQNEQRVLNLNKPIINNLGGMGPKSNELEQMRYDDVATVDGKAVHLIITSADDEYRTKNAHCYAKRTTGKAFIAKYNGGGETGRSDVMAIGSLCKGDFKFNFAFVDGDGNPVVIPFLPITFFDLDGSDAAEARGKSYEVVSSSDSTGIEEVEFSHVDVGCVGGVCTAHSAKQEITIPDDFSHLKPDTKKAAVTFFFYRRSSFDITYTLNYEHRVFLFKGQCIDEDEETTTTTRKRGFNWRRR